MVSRCNTMVLAIGSSILVALGSDLASNHKFKQSVPQTYLISGGIYKYPGGAASCWMRCWSDLGPIKYVNPDPTTGKYTVNLTPVEAEALRRFQIIDGSKDTSFFEFDRSLLVDSIIFIDFKLKIIPRQYRIESLITEHPPKRVNDTIWIDPQGKPVSKAVSDSLWRDIPHK